MEETHDTRKRSVEALNKALEDGQLDVAKALLGSAEARLLLSRDVLPETLVKVAHNSHWETLRFLLNDEAIPVEVSRVFNEGYFRPEYLGAEVDDEEDEDANNPRAQELKAFLATLGPLNVPQRTAQAQSLLSAVAYRSNMDMLKYLVEVRGVDVKRRWTTRKPLFGLPWAATSLLCATFLKAELP